MRFPLLVVIIILVVNIFVDAYVYCALHSYCRKRIWPRVQLWSAIVCAAALIVAMCLPKRGGSDGALLATMWILYSYLSIYVPKILFVIFDVLSRIPFLWGGRRWQWMSWSGFGLAIIVFLAMWWGAIFNKYCINIEEVEVPVKGLPQGLDGFTIAQISDLHVGTYGNNTSFVEDLVASVNALHPSMIVFTGDLVNRHSQELVPFMNALSQLHAPCGVFSVMGNHDYGDYYDWDSVADKEADVDSLKEMQKRMGWRMLNNEHVYLRKDGEVLVLIGVENVGDPPFKTYGDLQKAYPEIGDKYPKILLTHNPAHWEAEVQNNPHSNIILTLTGHTHAMQMELFGLSPAAWRYEKWGGLYEDGQNQMLYVNIGAGEVAFPARIGATPEITLFTLRTHD